MTKPFSERWNGSRWSIVETPALKGSYGELRDVSCLSASSCIAVGGTARPYPSPSGETTLAMFWNGAEWTLQPSPPAPKAFAVLHGVSCASAVTCMGVGRAAPIWEGGIGTVGLAERFE